MDFLRCHLLWVQQQTQPKEMTGNGQLTRGAFMINDFLRNPHFSNETALGHDKNHSVLSPCFCFSPEKNM